MPQVKKALALKALFLWNNLELLLKNNIITKGK